MSRDPTTFCVSMRIPSAAGTRQVITFGTPSTRARHPSHAARRHAGPARAVELGAAGEGQVTRREERHRDRLAPLGDDRLAVEAAASPGRAAVEGEASRARPP